MSSVGIGTINSQSAWVQGWKWVEEAWQIDLTGLEVDAIDKEGWSYATDFPWLRMPPGEGSGHWRKVGFGPTDQSLYVYAGRTCQEMSCKGRMQ